MSDEISILDIAERSGFKASLITTFNASLPFYEEIVLRRLRANGCHHNVVLMDGAQCSAAWASGATRPRHAGYDYTLLPIRSTGAFHPKIAIFAGPKRTSVLVGSHNLTASGFGYNRELTNLVELAGKMQEPVGRILNDIWNAISLWVEGASQYCPPELIENATSMQKYLKPFLSTSEAQTSTMFLSQTEGEISLFEQLKDSVKFGVRRLLVVGAFFDENLAFLKAVRSTWPKAEVVVGIDLETVYLPTVLQDPKTRFVDTGFLWTDNGSRYLHAKALFLEGFETQKIFISGSANPSGPGWGVNSISTNTEAMMLLKNADALEALNRTGLDKLFDLQSVPVERMTSTVGRALQLRMSNQHHSPHIVVATANGEAITVTLRTPEAEAVKSIVLLDDNDRVLATDFSFTSEGASIKIVLGEGIGSIRSLLLKTENSVIARAIVHHTNVVNAASSSTRQHQIRVALEDLGETETDISRLIEQVSSVIFSEDVGKHATSLKRTKVQLQETKVAERPPSLSMSVADIMTQRRKRKLLEGGDLGYLLDILIQRLHIPQATAPKSIGDATASNPEEGEDDDARPIPTSGMEDEAIAAAVYVKSRSLINKMIAREALAAAAPERVIEMVAQLTAVLAILKELKHLEMQGRWKDKDFALVDHDAMSKLMTKSMFYLFSSTQGLWRMVDDETISFEELGSLNVLLSWLAWEIGYDYKAVVPPVWELDDPSEYDFLLAGNGYVGKLFPRLVSDELTKSLQIAVGSTINCVPKEKADADSWLDRNVTLGKALNAGLLGTLEKSSANLRIGGFAYVANKIEPWTVVLDVDDKVVKLWDFQEDNTGNLEYRGFIRTFATSFVASLDT